MLEDFNYGRFTHVYESCSVVLTGKMWIFGGRDSRHFSSVGTCHLKTQGTMAFDLRQGAANTVKGFNDEESALLCFDYVTYKECHS